MDVPLSFRSAGTGPPVLLVHGGAEDLGMLTPQALAFAAHGRRAIWYDRRGTGGSTREGWPDGGVARHADDAAELIVNAEAVLRDDARIITTHAFAPGELPADRVTVAVGTGTDPLHAAIADRITADLGRPPLVVEEADDHEVYLSRPTVLADVLVGSRPTARAPSPAG